MAKVQTRRTIKGEDHQLVLLRVKQRDEYGRPRSADIVYDGDPLIDQSNLPDWVEAWVPIRQVDAKKVVPH